MPDSINIIYSSVDVLINELRKLEAVIVAQVDFNNALAVVDPVLAFGGTPATAAATINAQIALVGIPPTTSTDYLGVPALFNNSPITDTLDPLFGGASNPAFLKFANATQNASTIYKYVRSQVIQRTALWYFKDLTMNGAGSLRETRDWLLIKQALTFVNDMKRINLPRERAAQVTVMAQELQTYYGSLNAERGGLAANQWLAHIGRITYLTRWTVQCSHDTAGLLLAAGRLEDALDVWRAYVAGPLPPLLKEIPAAMDSWSPGCPSCL